jgi:hypothetical protein
MNYDVAKIRKELTNLVDKLKEQSDNVSNMEHVPSLEINVMMARVNRLYEKAVLYKHILIAEESLKEQMQAPELIVSETQTSEAINSEIQEELIVITEVPKKNTNHSAPVIETSEKKKNSISDGKPISSIKKYLGINERYLYANELFKGKMEDLLNALDEIDKQTTFENAQGLIKTKWAANYNWDDDNANVISFLKIVERRFL